MVDHFGGESELWDEMWQRDRMDGRSDAGHRGVGLYVPNKHGNMGWVKDRRGMGYDSQQRLGIPCTPIFCKPEWFAHPNGQVRHSWSLWGNDLPIPKVE
jgi:hypothetical protein